MLRMTGVYWGFWVRFFLAGWDRPRTNFDTSHQAARAAVVVWRKETPKMATEAASATPCQRSTPAVRSSSFPANEGFGIVVSGFTGAGALMNGYYGWLL